MDPQVLIDKLQSLGTADTIAEFLQEQRITGHWSSPNFCVIANYFAKECNSYNVGVFELNFSGIRIDNKYYPIDLVSPLRNFISKFDNCSYPELETK